MKLNHECVRDLLLTVEDECKPNYGIAAASFVQVDRMSKYSVEDVVYTTIILRDHGFLKSLPQDRATPNGREPVILHMTFEGHAFLDNIRDSGVWSGLKTKIARGMSSLSLAVFADLAQTYIKSEAAKLLP